LNKKEETAKKKKTDKNSTGANSFYQYSSLRRLSFLTLKERIVTAEEITYKCARQSAPCRIIERLEYLETNDSRK